MSIYQPVFAPVKRRIRTDPLTVLVVLSHISSVKLLRLSSVVVRDNCKGLGIERSDSYSDRLLRLAKQRARNVFGVDERTYLLPDNYAGQSQKFYAADVA